MRKWKVVSHKPAIEDDKEKESKAFSTCLFQVALQIRFLKSAISHWHSFIREATALIATGQQNEVGATGDQARAGKSASMVVILLNSTSTVLGKGEKRNDVLHSSGFQIGFLVLKCFEPTAAKSFNSRRGRRTHANRLDAQEVGLALPKPGLAFGLATLLRIWSLLFLQLVV